MGKTAEQVFDEIQAKGGYELSDAKSRDYFIDGFNEAVKIAQNKLNNTVDLDDVSERSVLLVCFLEWYWETYTKDMFHKDVVDMYIKSSNSR